MRASKRQRTGSRQVKGRARVTVSAAYPGLFFPATLGTDNTDYPRGTFTTFTIVQNRNRAVGPKPMASDAAGISGGPTGIDQAPGRTPSRPRQEHMKQVEVRCRQHMEHGDRAASVRRKICTRAYRAAQQAQPQADPRCQGAGEPARGAPGAGLGAAPRMGTVVCSQ